MQFLSVEQPESFIATELLAWKQSLSSILPFLSLFRGVFPLLRPSEGLLGVSDAHDCA